MEAAVHGPFAVFRTLFTPEYDLTQCFLGACTPTDHFTAPVDIHYAALLRHDTRDIWHIDRALSLCTDEAPPFLVCGEDLGGHHTPDTAVLLRADGSRFMQKHIGLVWKDEAGIPWTCINITPEGEGLFQGKADGSLQSGFRFPEAPHGRLTGSSGSFLPVSCRMHRSMGTLVRHTKRRITLRMGRKYVPLTDGSASCDEARMEECFEVVDPLTWAARLHAMRPQGGYEHGLPPAALGETLFSADMVHTLSGDGTWVTRFSLRAEKPAAWQGYLGLMTQERCCPEKGSVTRFVPGLKPAASDGCGFDPAYPLDLRALPAHRLTKGFWADPACPPGREICMITSPASCVCYAGGILPVMDGAPAKRAESITEAVTLSPAHKSYITFAGACDARGIPALGGKSLTALNGAVYKKYYPGRKDISVYTVPFEGKIWLYADLFGDREKEAVVPLPAGMQPEKFSQTGGAVCRLRRKTLSLRGTRGSAELVFRPEKEGNA